MSNAFTAKPLALKIFNSTLDISSSARQKGSRSLVDQESSRLVDAANQSTTYLNVISGSEWSYNEGQMRYPDGLYLCRGQLTMWHSQVR